MDLEQVRVDKGKQEDSEVPKVSSATDLSAVSADVDDVLKRTSLASLGFGRLRYDKDKSGSNLSGGGSGGERKGSAPPPPPNCRSHSVSRLDTLAGLAMRYGCTVEELKRINGLWSEGDLFARPLIYVPDTAQGAQGYSASVENERTQKCNDFAARAQCDVSLARIWLRRHGWNVEKAFEAFSGGFTVVIDSGSNNNDNNITNNKDSNLAASVGDDEEEALLEGGGQNAKAFFDPVLQLVPKDKAAAKKLQTLEQQQGFYDEL